MTQIKATLIDCMGSDLSVVNSARVSFGKESEWDYENYDEGGYGKLKKADAKLIHYLAKHKHLSPFGHVFASFHVKAPIFVARQLVKHKFLRWNEISRRYVDEEPEFYVPDMWRGRAEDKKQGSSGEVFVHDWSFDVADHQYDGHLHENSLYAATLLVYNNLLNQGVAPEMARMILPQSTMTEWYWSGSLDAFAQMCALRLKDDTQYESRVVAQQVNDEMTKLYPVSWVALMENL